MRSRRKIFYCTGLISLIMLPLLCLYHFDKQKAFDRLHCFEVNYWPTEFWNSRIQSSVRFNPLNYDKKNFSTITLTGSDTDLIKLDYARVAIDELIHQPDTTLGIEFIFHDNAKYESLVKLFDICISEVVPNYLNYQDKFWVFNWRPKVTEVNRIKHWICGTSSLANCVPLEISDNYQASTYVEIINLLKKFWMSAVLFAVMIGLTVVLKTGPHARK